MSLSQQDHWTIVRNSLIAARDSPCYHPDPAFAEGLRVGLNVAITALESEVRCMQAAAPNTNQGEQQA